MGCGLQFLMNIQLIPCDSQCVRAKLCCPGRPPEGLQVFQLPGLKIGVCKGKQRMSKTSKAIFPKAKPDAMPVSLSTCAAHRQIHT